MRAALTLLASALCLSGCASSRLRDADTGHAIMARIGEGEELRLPSPPAFPETQTLSQIIRANYGAVGGVIEASISLSPEQVTIVLAAPAGPRLATISWNADGFDVDKTLLAPPGLPAENILSDVFILLWPREAVQAAAPADCTVTDSDDGARTLACAGAPLIEITRDTENPHRRILRNLNLGYRLSITSVE